MARLFRTIPALAATLCLLVGLQAAGQEAGPPTPGPAPGSAVNTPPPAPPEIVLQRMEQRYLEQIARIESYEAHRSYRASNPKLSEPALWKVEETYHSPGVRILRIRERSGPRILDRLLLDRLLDVEQETATETVRPTVDLNRDNYLFRFVGYDPGRNLYRFDVSPRTDHPYRFRGSVWVNGEDFAVQRIEGSPAGSTSVWVRETRFVHEFARFGDLWFPVRHRSVAQLRWFGEATLEIDYSGYEWTLRRQQAQR